MHPVERGANDSRGLGSALARRLGARPVLGDAAMDERRHLHNGFGESLARAFELAVTPAIFAWFGWLIDRRLGTKPLFMLVLFAVVMSYMVWKMFGRYDADMRAHEERMFGRAEPKVPDPRHQPMPDPGNPPEPPA